MSALPIEKMAFRSLRSDELEQVAELEKQIYAFPWTIGNFRDSMNAGDSCWACTMNGELIGYAVMMVAAEEAHLLNISLASEWQGQGLGAQFLACLMQQAKDHASVMYLEVRPSNVYAQHLYERAGFQRIAMRPKYYPAFNGREDAIIFASKL